MCSIAFALGTGSAPGSARHTGHTFVLGSPPNAFGQPQNILLAVLSSTWHSIPMTASYFSSSSEVTVASCTCVIMTAHRNRHAEPVEAWPQPARRHDGFGHP